jgi:TrmH family RNA methyltransferase
MRSSARTLKLPLVAGTHPCAKHHRAVWHSAPFSLCSASISEVMRRSSVATPVIPQEIGLYNECLLTDEQSECIGVVLVAPRNPLNIGAVARAMANFGFSRLSVVAPYAPHWREARSAVGAPEVLTYASEYSTLADAVKSCALVIGTGTLTARKPDQLLVSLPNLMPHLQRELARQGSIALVFGPEKHGLTREDLALCHLFVEIPTSPQQPSMNLAQAVAVCLYEISSAPLRLRPDPTQAAKSAEMESAAPSGDLDRLESLAEETMRAAGYSPKSMQDANRHDLQVMLRRMHLNRKDARRLLGLFRRILWRLNHRDPDPHH